MQVENIHAPHYDVDGNPNFYWFEALIQRVVVRRGECCFFLGHGGNQ